MRSICFISSGSSEVIPTLYGYSVTTASGVTASACAYCSPTVSYQQFTNVTVVSPYESGSSYTYPYARPEVFSAPDCSPWFDYHCGYDGVHLECGIPLSSSVDIGTGSVHLKRGYYTNAYNSGSSGSYTPIPSKANSGYKIIYANKWWHGQLPYNSVEWMSYDKFQDWCCACPEIVERGSPETTHYLTLSATTEVTGSYKLTDTSSDYEYYYLGNAAGSTSIGRYTGDISTAQVCTSASSFTLITGSYTPDSSSIAYYADFARGLLSQANGNITEVAGRYCSHVTSYNSTDYSLNVTSVSNSVWHCDVYLTESGSYAVAGTGSYTGHIWRVYDIDLNGSYHYQEYNLAYAVGGGTVLYKNLDESLEVTATTYEFKRIEIARTSGYTGTTTVKVHGVLSDSYTAAQVKSDAVNLLNNFSLADDVLYPWRCDSNITEAPLLSYNELDGEGVPNLTCDAGYSGSGVYDGSILGLPLPKGYDKWWNPRHKNWSVCTNDIGCTTKYIESYGAWSTETAVASSTQWTDLNQQTNLPQGALFGNSFFFNSPSSCATVDVIRGFSGVWAAKYAELVQPKESFDYTRPCGIDRLTIEENSGRCISNVSGNDITLSTSGATGSLNTGDYAWVCGIGNDGVWTVTKTGDYTYTLSTLIASASSFPSVPIDDCGSGVIGKLKYPWSSNAGICGNLGITAIANSSTPITCSLAAPTYLVNNDLVTIANVQGLAINASYYVTVIDNQTIALNGSSAISGSYVSGTGYVYTNPSASYSEVAPKGDFTNVTWKRKWRDIDEYYRLQAQYTSSVGSTYDCTDTSSNCNSPAVSAYPRPYNETYGVQQDVVEVSCAQQCYNATGGLCAGNTIAYISPTVENFDTSSNTVVYLGWLPDFTPDNQYGALNIMFIKQYDRDYLFAPPPCVCSDSGDGYYDCNCANREDDGSCKTDETDPCVHYYAMPNLIESRCSLPSGSMYNNSYAKAKMGCLSESQMASGSSGNACAAPDNTLGASYSTFGYNIYALPYCIYYNNKHSCVCDSGTFADIYYAQGISCDNGNNIALLP